MLLSTPLVSVVIPSYNYGHLIGETLDSLLAQTYSHWECIIVDDGSQDATAAVVKAYQQRDQRFIYVHQTNKGTSSAKNEGLRRCTGEFIHFLDADDKLAHNKLLLQLAYLEQHPDVDLIYSDVRYFTTEAPELRRYSMYEPDRPWLKGISGRGEEMLKVMIRDNQIVINACLFRKKVLERVGFFDESISHNEDWEYWIRCILAGFCFYFDPRPQAWALVRMHAISASRSYWNMLHGQVQMRFKLMPQLKGSTGAYNRQQARHLLDTLERFAMYDFYEGKYEECKKKFFRLHRASGYWRFRLWTWFAQRLPDPFFKIFAILYYEKWSEMVRKKITGASSNNKV